MGCDDWVVEFILCTTFYTGKTLEIFIALGKTPLWKDK